MNRENIFGVSWVLSYGGLVLVFGGGMANAGSTPELIVSVSVLVLPFVAQIPGLILDKMRVGGRK